MMTESKLTLTYVNSAVPSYVTRHAVTRVVINSIYTCCPVFTWLIIKFAVVYISLTVYACNENKQTIKKVAGLCLFYQYTHDLILIRCPQWGVFH